MNFYSKTVRFWLKICGSRSRADSESAAKSGFQTGILTSNLIRKFSERNPPPATIAFPIATSKVRLKSGVDPGTIFRIKWFNPSFQFAEFADLAEFEDFAEFADSPNSRISQPNSPNSRISPPNSPNSPKRSQKNLMKFDSDSKGQPEEKINKRGPDLIQKIDSFELFAKYPKILSTLNSRQRRRRDKIPADKCGPSIDLHDSEKHRNMCKTVEFQK